MKVNKPGVCDFCGVYPAKYTINGGLWWLCRPCMDIEFGKCRCTEELQLVCKDPECKYPGDDEE